MGWATVYIDKLKKGETVQFRPRGNSMKGEIDSGQLCTVVPIKAEEAEVGDIVLCKVNGNQYLRLVKARQGQRFQIGNNRGPINGWVDPNRIYGRCVRVE
jgi:SOS-response transcriptional repressor LexA